MAVQAHDSETQRAATHEESAFVCFSSIYQCTEASVCVCVCVCVSVQMRPKEPHVAFCHRRGWSCCSRSAYQYSAHQPENQRPGMYFPGHLTGSGRRLRLWCGSRNLPTVTHALVCLTSWEALISSCVSMTVVCKIKANISYNQASREHQNALAIFERFSKV